MGHSMGAKVACVVARWAEAGVAGLGGLERVVTLAGSPPGPEPMEEAQRAKMLGWFMGDAAQSRSEAAGFVEQNVAAPLPDAIRGRTEADVVRADVAAWRAWLLAGSNEDWTEGVGVLRTPGLVVAGAEDEMLGEAAQRELMVPHFSEARLVVLDGAKHLLPQEKPAAVAALLLGGLPVAYRALIESGRVSTPTRDALLDRAVPDDAGYRPLALTEQQLATLRAVVDEVLPQPAPAIDLAARIDAELAEGKGDGWRPATLPADAEAYRLALMDLVAAGYASAPKGILQRVADGDDLGGALNGPQMKLWFEDVRAAAARHYTAHPLGLARMGYSGIGIGGDGAGPEGFAALGEGVREAWEPEALGRGAVR